MAQSRGSQSLTGLSGVAVCSLSRVRLFEAPWTAAPPLLPPSAFPSIRIF